MFICELKANCKFFEFIHLFTSWGRYHFTTYSVKSFFLFVLGQVYSVFWSSGRLLQHRLFGAHWHHLCHLQKSECLSCICWPFGDACAFCVISFACKKTINKWNLNKKECNRTVFMWVFVMCCVWWIDLMLLCYFLMQIDEV